MKLIALCALTMTAFAANSILNRLGVGSGAISPDMFSLVRVVSGAATLVVLVALRGRGLSLRPSLWGVLGLALYLFGFSQAYLALDAGLGALILFGGVQITMFSAGLVMREAIPVMRWIGTALALAGLIMLSGGIAVDGASRLGVAMMSLAAIGWGIYSLVGRGSKDALAGTAANFLFCAPIMILPVLFTGTGEVLALGWLTAVASGAVTSGLGYALWYTVLPRLSASVAALAQLTVPVIAAAAGVVLLGESLSLTLILSGALVLAGVALGLVPALGRKAE